MSNNLEKYKKLFEEELFDRVVPFWLKNGPDRECGGLLHCLDRGGRLFSEDKGVWMQGRAGWMFSYLYNNFDKRAEYLELAKSCIDFATERCFLEDGRMSLVIGRDGEVVCEQGTGWFSEAFYISACAEYSVAAKDGSYLALAKECYDRVIGWYNAECNTPCQENTAEKPRRRLTKAFAQPMILLNVTGIMRSADPGRTEYYNGISDSLCRDIKKFHSDEHRATIECISTDNRFILESSNCRIMNPGHVIECSWFVLEEAMERGDDALAAYAEQMFSEAYERGYDDKYGGIVYYRDILGGPVEAYEQDLKIWWVHNEAVIASLMLYLHTGKEKYREIFEKITEYSFSHFSCPEGGEWYHELHRDGTPGEPNLLGFIYKGPFHVPRMLAKCLIMLDSEKKK